MCVDRRKSYDSSIALNRQETPQKAKDAEDYLNGELCSRKKDVNKDAWNLKKTICMCRKKQ